MDGEPFLNGSVEAKGNGQDDRDDGESSHLNGHDSHAKDCNGNTQFLWPQQSFFIDQDAQQYIKQWIDVIAKARVEYVLVRNGPNVGEPVDADKYSSQ